MHIQKIKTINSDHQWKIVSYKNFLTASLAHFIKDKLNNDPNCGLFAVFDGHGGRQVSDHCAERIGDEMRKEIAKTPGDLSGAIEAVFLRINDELRLIDADNTGSTGCVAIVRQEMGQKVLYVANVGDTRAVMSKNGIAERMSYDHKATDQGEYERIKASKGLILDGRVGGTLAITRAFGDHSLKPAGVIANPYIKKHILKITDKFLILASDGVWDGLEDQEAVNYCKEDCSTKDIAQAIVKGALDKGSKDNISCLVIRFHSTAPF